MFKKTQTHRIIAWQWPLICGLVIGGLLGAIMHSFAAFLLFGVIGWGYFYFDFFLAQKGKVISGDASDEPPCFHDAFPEHDIVRPSEPSSSLDEAESNWQYNHYHGGNAIRTDY